MMLHIPHSTFTQGVKAGWKAAWQVFMRELAPQSRDGAYARPAYTFTARIGDPQHPVCDVSYKQHTMMLSYNNKDIGF